MQWMDVCSRVYCRRFVVLPVMYGTTLSLTQTVPVPGTRSGFWWEKTRTMMAHAPSPTRLALPRLTRRPGLVTLYQSSARCSARPRLAMDGYPHYLTDGATVDTRPRPALLPSQPSRTTSLPEPTKQSTARNPYRSVRQHLLVSPISHQATRANSLAHPPSG
jgi:hypothetical protein